MHTIMHIIINSLCIVIYRNTYIAIMRISKKCVVPHLFIGETKPNFVQMLLSK